MENEVLTVNVHITGAETVKGSKAEACMILFDGTAEGSGFKGEILPGGVDTQNQVYNSRRYLSARYILKGLDKDGKETRIFVENNGFWAEDGSLETKPVILTDNPSLSFLESDNLYGTLEGQEGGVIIHIFKK
ncbi:MAG: DUF3237 domain-containing protein [Treponema sp.]|nr:DUF3237 domain-containing protein [Treponema sp.]